MNATQLLPAIRDLYSKHPENIDILEDEGEIAAAVDVARQDAPEWWKAA